MWPPEGRNSSTAGLHEKRPGDFIKLQYTSVPVCCTVLFTHIFPLTSSEIITLDLELPLEHVLPVNWI